jgi:1-phosphatidylinositol phosphodiesterase
MGAGGYLRLTNNTDRQWVLDNHHSYQMTWDFPVTIKAWSQCDVYVEWREHIFDNQDDDAAEARYRLDGTDICFEIQARARGEGGRRLQVVLVNLSAPGYPSGGTVQLGWRHDGTVKFLLHGRADNLRLATAFDWADVLLTDWMATLPGDWMLSQLNLPGTNSACARECTEISQSQSMTVRQQLEAGVRFLDVRCRHVGDALAIHHGGEFLHQWFDEVRDACYAFLDAHPRETIVMLVRDDHHSSNTSRSYAETFDASISATKGGWYLGDQVPTLDNVRGKIVLIRQFPAVTTYGIDASDDSSSAWLHDRTFTLTRNGVQLVIQDRRTVSKLEDTADQLELVMRNLEAAATDVSSRWHVNYANGTGAGYQPESVAKGVAGLPGLNLFVATYLQRSSPGRYGTILIDFPEYPDDSLIKTIVGLNPTEESNVVYAD